MCRALSNKRVIHLATSAQTLLIDTIIAEESRALRSEHQPSVQVANTIVQDEAYSLHLMGAGHKVPSSVVPCYFEHAFAPSGYHVVLSSLDYVLDYSCRSVLRFFSCGCNHRKSYYPGIVWMETKRAI
jgi:hypothetical protein